MSAREGTENGSWDLDSEFAKSSSFLKKYLEDRKRETAATNDLESLKKEAKFHKKENDEERNSSTPSSDSELFRLQKIYGRNDSAGSSRQAAKKEKLYQMLSQSSGDLKLPELKNSKVANEKGSKESADMFAREKTNGKLLNSWWVDREKLEQLKGYENTRSSLTDYVSKLERSVESLERSNSSGKESQSSNFSSDGNNNISYSSSPGSPPFNAFTNFFPQNQPYMKQFPGPDTAFGVPQVSQQLPYPQFYPFMMQYPPFTQPQIPPQQNTQVTFSQPMPFPSSTPQQPQQRHPPIVQLPNSQPAQSAPVEANQYAQRPQQQSYQTHPQQLPQSQPPQQVQMSQQSQTQSTEQNHTGSDRPPMKQPSANRYVHQIRRMQKSNTQHCSDNMIFQQLERLQKRLDEQEKARQEFEKKLVQDTLDNSSPKLARIDSSSTSGSGNRNSNPKISRVESTTSDQNLISPDSPLPPRPDKLHVRKESEESVDSRSRLDTSRSDGSSTIVSFDNDLTNLEERSMKSLVKTIFSRARHNRVEDVRKLLDRGVDVNARDSFGNTILTIASQNGHKSVMKLLLQRGCDINAQNHKGQTSLHFCFAYGYTDLGEWLISKGADDTIKNVFGLTCYEGLTPK